MPRYKDTIYIFPKESFEDTIVQTRRRLASAPKYGNFSLLSKIEPNNFTEASKEKHWIDAMEEELNQIKKNET
jgi:hypothetical protein